MNYVNRHLTDESTSVNSEDIKELLKKEIASLKKDIYAEINRSNDSNKNNEIDKLSKNETFLDINKLPELIEQCIKLGTIPFSILARHGFIAKTLLERTGADIVFFNREQSGAGVKITWSLSFLKNLSVDGV